VPSAARRSCASRGIFFDERQRGLLEPGGTVVEGVAGNTGVGLAHLWNARLPVRHRDARQPAAEKNLKLQVVMTFPGRL